MAVSRVTEQKASDLYKWIALGVLAIAILYCLLLAGLAEWGKEKPFVVDEANFAFFSAFIIVAGAIERFMEPIASVLPPSGDGTPEKSARALMTLCIALVVGIIVSSVFGLYFMEAVGAGVPDGVVADNGDKWIRGLDVFITALIITGGSKQLHELIKTIEKKKENLEAGT